MTVPFIEPLCFIGRNLYADTADIWFFQAAAEFISGQATDIKADPEISGVLGLSEDELEDLVDWSGLVDELTENKKMQDEGKFLSQRIPVA